MNEATQTGVAMAAIGAVGTIAGLLFGYLRDKDKLAYDVKLTLLTTKVEGLTSQNTTQASQIAALTEAVHKCEERHKKRDEETREHVPLPPPKA